MTVTATTVALARGNLLSLGVSATCRPAPRHVWAPWPAGSWCAGRAGPPASPPGSEGPTRGVYAYAYTHTCMRAGVYQGKAVGNAI
jgi:hypothetical protein